MKRIQNQSALAEALQISIAMILMAISARCVQGSPNPSPTATGTPTPCPGCTPTPTPTPTPSPIPIPTPCGVIYSENFDNSPALPAGWTASASQLGAVWSVSNIRPLTAPYEVRGISGGTSSECELITAEIAVPATGGVLFFRNLFDFAVSTPDNLGQEGVVLEISINGSVYSDIIDAGGSFVMGGYNRTIRTDVGNPLAGRMAWSGRSAGVMFAPDYITTAIQLPAAAEGRNIRLKWRLGSDIYTAVQGIAQIDEVVLPVSCATPTPIPTPSSSPEPTVTISGSVGNCASPAPTATPPANPTPPVLPAVPNVLMALTGSSSSTTLTDSSGNYSFAVATGGSYTITPGKGPLAPASAGINNIDVLAIQRHFLAITVIPEGCRLTAADANLNGLVNSQDIISVQRFFLGFTSGTGSCGQYKFTPAGRSYSSVGSNQPGQNYSMYVVGDVAASFANLPEGRVESR